MPVGRDRAAAGSTAGETIGASTTATSGQEDSKKQYGKERSRHALTSSAEETRCKSGAVSKREPLSSYVSKRRCVPFRMMLMLGTVSPAPTVIVSRCSGMS